MTERSSQQTERRRVRAEDPSLSPAANELLTDELQEIVGAGEVVVSRDAPRRHDDHHAQSPAPASLTANRPILIVTFLVALVVGGVVALVTEEYWAVVLALALHAVGTLAVTFGAIALTTETEHVDPAVAARLEEEGVAAPDRVVSQMSEEFAGAGEARGAREVVTSDRDDRSPTPGLERWIVLALAVLSVASAAILGGDTWALPAIFLPLGAGWIALRMWTARGGDDAGRNTADDAAAGRQLVPVGVFVVAGVIWFTLVLGLIAGLL